MLNSLKSAFSKLLSKPAASDETPHNPMEYELNLPDKRNGKIAHLPRDLRDIICQRIYDNASLTQLAEALNQLPEVKAVMANHFDAKPISKQNLSEWKAGGYRDWLLKRQLLDQKAETVADAQQLAQTADGLADSLFGMLTLDYAQIMMNREKDDKETFEKKRAALSILSQDIVRLRRCHLQARRVEIQEGRFERDEEKTREQVLHKFAEWASHPDIRRIFILEPLNHMRLLREKYGLPPTKEDLLLLQELQKNYPNSTSPEDCQTTDQPRPTENSQPDPTPVKPPASEAASQSHDHGIAATASPSPGGEGRGEGELNSKPNPQNSSPVTRHASLSSVRPISPVSPIKPASEKAPKSHGHGPASTASPSPGGEGRGEGELKPSKPKYTHELIAEAEASVAQKNQPQSSTPKSSPLPPPFQDPLAPYKQALREGKSHWEALETLPIKTVPSSPPTPPQTRYTLPGHNPLDSISDPVTAPPRLPPRAPCYGPCPPPWTDGTHLQSKLHCG